MKNLDVKIVCACGEEVTEEDTDKLKQIESILLEGRKHNVALKDIAVAIYTLMQSHGKA
jgi:hypothetical protein